MQPGAERGRDGSFWDVPGLGDEVGDLLGDPTGGNSPAPRRRPAVPPTVDARALVRDSVKLGSNLRDCRDALGGARRAIENGIDGGGQREPAVQAWLALMDELLLFGERMSARLLEMTPA